MRSEVIEVKRTDVGRVHIITGMVGDTLSAILPEIAVGESRKVKVTVEFVETPRERLKRVADEIGHGLSWRDEYERLRDAVQDYLAAAECESTKKGGG